MKVKAKAKLRADHRRLLWEYEQAMLARGLAVSTRANQRGLARRFLAFVRRRIDRVRREDAERYLSWRKASLAATTLESEHYRLRSFFQDMVQLGHTERNPLDGLCGLPAARPTPLLLSQVLVERLLVHASVPVPGGAGRPLALRDRALLELLYGAGLRNSEVCRVRTNDLDLSRGELSVRPAKRGSPRRVPLPSAALPHLCRYLEEGRGLLDGGRGQDEGALLLNCRGRPLATHVVRSVVARLAERIGEGERAGKLAHPHAFRRAIATHLARSGASVLAVQELLGHQRLTTTQGYMEVEWEDLVKAARVVELRPGRGRP